MTDDEIPDVDLELEKGDYVYQTDQELFLVVTSVNEDSYEFAVHGWREIADYRLQEYLEEDAGKLHKQGEVEQVVEGEADDETKEKFNKLTELFAKYGNGLSDEGAHTQFTLEDTDNE